MRSAPPIAPGMPRRNASPAMAASCAARATFTSGTAVPARTRSPGSTLTSPKPRPSRITTPGTPPSRTIRLEPRPTTVTGMSAGRLREEIREVRLVLRHEQHLRRPADAEPGQRRQRLVRQAAGRAAAAAALSGRGRCRERSCGSPTAAASRAVLPTSGSAATMNASHNAIYIVDDRVDQVRTGNGSEPARTKMLAETALVLKRIVR